ncbi:esterase/lipase family protein [Sinomonas sp.]|uniref:esterase/lipase family protein n=1 Tax=Sinomonas sp. TaxID=1914986 RepID=UPI002FE19086
MDTAMGTTAAPREALAVAGGVVLDWGYALWRQVASFAQGRVTTTTVHPPEGTPGGASARKDKAEVVLIPGIYEPAGFMDPLRRRLQERGHRVVVLPELGYNRRTIPETADVAAARLRELRVKDAVVIAHSKGGLVGKLLMTAYAQDGLVVRMLAVGTPFEGARYSRYAPTRPLRSFYPGHPVLGSLAKNLEVNARIVSVGARVDPLVGRSTRLEGGSNIVLPVTGHFRILASRELMAVVDDFLRNEVGGSGEQAGGVIR